MDYRICEATSTEVLRREVTEAIGEGWRPAGGVALGVAFNNFFFYQAMTREVPTPRAQGPGPVVIPPIPPVRPTPPELGQSVGPRPPRRSEEG